MSAPAEGGPAGSGSLSPLGRGTCPARRGSLDGHRRALVLLSGGLDSTVSLYLALRRGIEVRALTFGFHARSPREARAAEEVARAAGVDLETIDLPFLREVQDLELHAAHPLLALRDRVPPAYVPGRNLVFYGVAAARAEALGATAIVGGHLEGDGEAFPDAAPDFFELFERLVRFGSWSARVRPIEIVTPLAGLRKSAVLSLAIELSVPLGATFSCYGAGPLPCGGCPSCEERRDAFRALGLRDPACP